MIWYLRLPGTTPQRDALVEKFMSLDAATGDDDIADDADDESILGYEDNIDYKRRHPSGSAVDLNLILQRRCSKCTALKS